jgi:hypothetical protein
MRDVDATQDAQVVIRENPLFYSKIWDLSDDINEGLAGVAGFEPKNQFIYINQWLKIIFRTHKI